MIAAYALYKLMAIYRVNIHETHVCKRIAAAIFNLQARSLHIRHQYKTYILYGARVLFL